MKKSLLLSFILLSGYLVSFSQELVVSGNMESSEAWQFSSPNGTDVTDLVTATFNYTDDIPTDGADGCLRLTGFGTTRSVTWQKVTITPGHKYTFSGAFKNISTDALTNTWVEVILSRAEPDPTKDYGAGNGDYIYSNNSWMTAPYGSFDGLDGLLISLSQFSCKKGSEGGTEDLILTTNELTIPDSVTVTDWYVSIKAGCWNTAGSSTPTFDFLFDNISLIDVTGSGVANANIVETSYSVYPNPADGVVSVFSPESNTIQYHIYAVTGALVKSGNVDVNSTIDCSLLSKGSYVIKLDNGKSTGFQKLVIK